MRAIHFASFTSRIRLNPEAALIEAMKWWQALESAPDDENEMLRVWLPLLQEKLHSDKLRSLTREEFSDVCAHVHAVRDHALRVSWRSFGLDEPLAKMSMEERSRYFGNWLYEQKATNGMTVLDAIHYVLHGGTRETTPQRIFETCFDPARKIPHMGISSFGEMVGWVHPDYSPPRNGRTSKALVALGNDVMVHSE